MKPENPNPLPLSRCPTCGYQTDAATVLETGNCHPNEGDFSVCLKCGELQVFTQALTLRVAEINDLLNVPQGVHAQLLRIQKLVRRVRPLDKKL